MAICARGYFFMGKIIFVTGAARSGKSAFAVDAAKGISDKKVAFVATCRPQDAEMKARVAAHKKGRPYYWKTVECGDSLLEALKGVGRGCKVVIVDCLTLFVSGLLMKRLTEKEIADEVKAAADFLSKAPYTAIVVSNEVGSGIVPKNRLARSFRDLAGSANQAIAKKADEAYLVVSGIPVRIKGG